MMERTLNPEFFEVLDAFRGVYYCLAASGITLIVWASSLISHAAYLGFSSESVWVRQSRRASLVLVALSIALSADWHFQSGKTIWPPELLMILGINLYLIAAIYSSYQRIKHERPVSMMDGSVNSQQARRRWG